MIEIINILRSQNFYGCSDTIEIAKGKNEMVTDWKGFKCKINRLWRLPKR
jgi:hypothetical protein